VGVPKKVFAAFTVSVDRCHRSCPVFTASAAVPGFARASFGLAAVATALFKVDAMPAALRLPPGCGAGQESRRCRCDLVHHFLRFRCIGICGLTSNVSNAICRRGNSSQPVSVFSAVRVIPSPETAPGSSPTAADAIRPTPIPSLMDPGPYFATVPTGTIPKVPRAPTELTGQSGGQP